MRKTILILIGIVFTTLHVAHSQEFRAGGGLAYGSQINNIGFDFRGDIKFNPQWAFTPNFNIFLNRKDGLSTNKWNAFNFDGHYFFEIDQTWTVYPLLGLNVASVTEKINDISFSHTKVGANIGFGSEYNFGEHILGFGELKYVISNADQLVITIGMLYTINN